MGYCRLITQIFPLYFVFCKPHVSWPNKIRFRFQMQVLQWSMMDWVYYSRLFSYFVQNFSWKAITNLNWVADTTDFFPNSFSAFLLLESASQYGGWTTNIPFPSLLCSRSWSCNLTLTNRIWMATKGSVEKLCPIKTQWAWLYLHVIPGTATDALQLGGKKTLIDWSR